MFERRSCYFWAHGSWILDNAGWNKKSILSILFHQVAGGRHLHDGGQVFVGSRLDWVFRCKEAHHDAPVQVLPVVGKLLVHVEEVEGVGHLHVVDRQVVRVLGQQLDCAVAKEFVNLIGDASHKILDVRSNSLPGLKPLLVLI